MSSTSGGSSVAKHENLKMSRDLKSVAYNPLSGGGLLQPPPLSDFPSYHFCVFAKIAIRSIYPPFVQIPMYLWKNFSKIFAVGKVGGGGLQHPPPS